MREARSIWFEAPNLVALRREALPPLGDADVLVRALALGVSAGTESLVLAGRVPMSIRAEMALPTQRGSFDFPLCYGYAAVGEIVAVGREVPPSRVGERVFALHPHQDWFVVPSAMARRLPASVPAPRATLAANLETALTAIWDAEIALGERVVVTGLGVVGTLVARLAKAAGAEVLAFDPNHERAKLAQTLGIHAASSALDEVYPHKADVLVETSGSTDALATLVSAAGFEARIVVVSWYGEREAHLPLGGAFHSRRLSLLSSQVGTIPRRMRGRFDYARRFEVVARLLEDAALDALIAPPVSMSDAPRLYADLARGERACPPHWVFDPSL